MHLEAAPEGGVVFSRFAKGERHEADLRAEILDAVTAEPRCSLNHVKSSVSGRGESVGKLVKEMIGTGELVDSGQGKGYVLSVGDALGTTLGITKSGEGGSRDKPDGNNAESPGNHLGATSGTAGGSVVPTPIRGDGNHHEKPPISADLSVDPSGWTGQPKDRLDELLGSGRKTAAAVEMVRAEFAVDAAESR